MGISENILSISNFNKLAVNDYHRTYLFKVLIKRTGFSCTWVSTSATPVMVTSQLTVDYMHTQIRQAGKTNPQQWQVTIRDDLGGKAFEYFQNWRDDIYPGVMPVNSYKSVADVQLISPQKSTDVRSYKLFGVWPMELGTSTLDYDQENIVTFPVTLSYDFYRVENFLWG